MAMSRGSWSQDRKPREESTPSMRQLFSNMHPLSAPVCVCAFQSTPSRGPPWSHGPSDLWLARVSPPCSGPACPVLPWPLHDVAAVLSLSLSHSLSLSTHLPLALWPFTSLSFSSEYRKRGWYDVFFSHFSFVLHLALLPDTHPDCLNEDFKSIMLLQACNCRVFRWEGVSTFVHHQAVCEAVSHWDLKGKKNGNCKTTTL